MTEVTEVNQILKTLQEEIRNKRDLQNKLEISEDNIEELKKQLLETCEHKHVIQYRYYGSGMHRAEFSTECKQCYQRLNFDQYIKAETTEKRDG